MIYQCAPVFLTWFSMITHDLAMINHDWAIINHDLAMS